MKRGKLITLEGTEGSGKSVQTRLLADYLKKSGYKVIITREPGNTHIGQSIRKLLLDPKNKALDSVTELFLYLADRAQHVKETIEPYLKKGYIVLCDRFMDATQAYQGYGRKLPIDLIDKLNKLAIRGIRPDLTILLNVPVELGLKRAIREADKGKKKGPKGGDRMERQAIKFHYDVHNGYLKIAENEPKRVKVIKVNNNIDEAQKEIRKLVLRVI